MEQGEIKNRGGEIRGGQPSDVPWLAVVGVLENDMRK